ncbi:hypothetical protein HY345_02935 [Candidatus Microgenomates bacterium]|nr:hypothetical protein [Candidatus Microgenomates bacterium]
MKASNFFPILSLLISNLIPVYGVLFWGWKVFPILVTYWLENVTVGFWNVFKIKKCVGEGKLPPGVIAVKDSYVASSSKKFLVGFFVVHYGIFTFVHGILLFTFFGLATQEKINPGEIVIAFIFLLISHGISYYTNFLGREEFRQNSATQQMFKPYSRIIVMHLVIIFGAFIVLSTGSSTQVLLLLVGMKIIVDLASHLFEHKFRIIPGNTA